MGDARRAAARISRLPPKIGAELLARASPADRNAIRAAAGLDPVTLPDDCEGWLRALFPEALSKPFAPHHDEVIEWGWKMGPERPRPLVVCWARGGGKSTLLALIAVMLGARNVRSYGIVISATQPLADGRVAEIAHHLEGSSVETYFPEMGERDTTKFGQIKGWTRKRLHTKSGFVLEAVGLEDHSIRGFLKQNRRPDLFLPDEFDALHDSQEATAKKMGTLTQSILPMGADNASVLMVQNKIIPDGIMAQMLDGRAAALATRIVVGPIPAVRGLKTYQWGSGEAIPDDIRANSEIDLSQYQGKNEGITHRTLITHGTPTWEGQDIAACQAEIDHMGIQAFLREQQHEVDEVEGALWTGVPIGRVGSAPDLVRIVVGVDPASHFDDIGIVAAGIDFKGRIYVIDDSTVRAKLGIAHWGWKSVETYDRLEADLLVAEINFGGLMVENTIEVAARDARDGADGKKIHAPVAVKMVNSSRGKQLRAEPVVMEYAKKRVFHAGVFPELERQMTQWVPPAKSPDRLDALVFAITELLFPEPVAQRTWTAGLPY